MMVKKIILTDVFLLKHTYSNKMRHNATEKKNMLQSMTGHEQENDETYTRVCSTDSYTIQYCVAIQ